MKKKRLATGIYEDASGRIIRISVNGEPVEYRKDKKGQPYKNRETAWLIKERIRRQADATLVEEIKTEKAALFPADVDRFLDTLSGKHKINVTGYMAHWTPHFEDKTRNEITDLDVLTAFASIDQANSTKTHIRRALIHFYEAMNGVSGYNPGRALKKPPKDEPDIRDIAWADIEAIFEALQPSRGRARLKVIAYIGMPHKQIKLLTRPDLRLERREVVTRPRRKGAGAAGVTQPLSDLGVLALEEFIAADAFGTFQNQQLNTMFKAAALRAKVTLPAKASPYWLRHSFLTEVARGGADIRDIARLGNHATLEQAVRYTKGVTEERATKTIQSIPRFLTTSPRGKRPKPSISVQRQTRGRTPSRRKTRGRKR